MYDDSRQRPAAPFFTAPGVVVWLSGVIIAAHGLRLLLPENLAGMLFYHFALIPERLALWSSSAAHSAAYGPVSLIGAGLGHVFLHVDWMHVILNTGMLLALGAPVARRLNGVRFVALFFAAALTGAALFFLLRAPDSAPAIGASGGVSGVLAGAFLIMADPRATWPVLLSPTFLKTSAAFFLLNFLLAFMGPSLFGMAIAWDAHIGGYIGGAIIMAAFASR